MIEQLLLITFKLNFFLSLDVESKSTTGYGFWFMVCTKQALSVLIQFNLLVFCQLSTDLGRYCRTIIIVYFIASIVMTIANSIQVAHKDDESLLKDDAI